MPIKKKNLTKNDQIKKDQISDLRSKADKGDANAQYLLGGLYDIGLTVPHDYVQARQWWEQAAAQGHAEAQYLLGGLYDIGHGVPQNHEKARQWYEQAVFQGHAEAQQALMNLNEDTIAGTLAA